MKTNHTFLVDANLGKYCNPADSDITGTPTAEALTFLNRLVATGGDRTSYVSPYGRVYFFNHPDDVRSVLQDRNFIRPPLMKSGK